MSFFPDDLSSSAEPLGGAAPSPGGADPTTPLLNLSSVQSRMDILHKFLSDSVNNNTLISKNRMDMVSTEISSAIHQIIVNGAALLACTQNPNLSGHNIRNPDFQLGSEEIMRVDPKFELIEDEDGDDYEIIELDAVELLAEHIHFCEICGKGFKRDANLRMHMRAHGNQYKTPEALAKPLEKCNGLRKTKFSCPYVGCNRNKKHKTFRPLKSVICVKNHFKRSHCPKMHYCNRCNKKSFAVVADLKSHLKHCGEIKWKCSCGTSFSRKDKLFGHMALFEGHKPAVLEEEDKGKAVAIMVEDDEEGELKLNPEVKEMEKESLNDGFFDGLMVDGFGSIDNKNYCFEDMLGSPNLSNNDGLGNGIDGWFL